MLVSVLRIDQLKRRNANYARASAVLVPCFSGLNGVRLATQNDRVCGTPSDDKMIGVRLPLQATIYQNVDAHQCVRVI